ncbi:M1 family metallopeptidase [Chloroflexia bacterium SDU3-3]|nr:M1 family metallopeptidase [Chloroflexia bacterium SDU3-3]
MTWHPSAVARWAALALAALALAASGGLPAARAQGGAAPQTASYQIEAALDPAAKLVRGSGQITYRNPSQDTLHELYIRLYLKAFRDTKTLWMRESGGQLRGDQMDPTKLGDITVEKLAIAGGGDLLATSTLSDTLLRVPLPQPLGPGQELKIDAEWTSRLPRVFARTGYGGRDDTFFMVGQWYPKLAVYDRGRWDTEPWHGNAEFFNEFGSYDVRVTVPQQYVVAGAGVPAGEQANADGTKTLRFTSADVTDWAFAASPDFLTASTRSGDVDIALYYMPEHKSAVDEHLRAAAGSIAAFSEWYGPYPHPRLTVVDVPSDATGAGGMEYPTFVTTEHGGGMSGFPTYVTAHEIGHQWWPMQTATNEGAEPWLDEGLTEYSGMRYMEETGTRIGGALGASALTYTRIGGVAIRAPATLPAWEYGSGDYSVVYFKTALGLRTMENLVGTERFRAAMRAYLTAYRFKHPDAQDFRRTIEAELGPQPWFFDSYMPTDAVIDYTVKDISGSSATIQRVGEVPVPVEIELTTEGGARELRTWDGQGGTATLTAAGPIAQVDIDPAQKLAAEANRSDNFRTVGRQVLPIISFGERLSFWVQIFLQSFGLFG